MQIAPLDVGGVSAPEAFDRFLQRPLEVLCKKAAGRRAARRLLDETPTFGGEPKLAHVLRPATHASEELPPKSA